MPFHCECCCALYHYNVGERKKFSLNRDFFCLNHDFFKIFEIHRIKILQISKILKKSWFRQKQMEQEKTFSYPIHHY